jgi:uncharacterized damage-inducible protein DinB
MNDGLIDALHHNSWATHELLNMCQDLTESHLDKTVPGVYGSIIATFQHIIRSEAGYYRRLTGDEPQWLQIVDDDPDIAGLIQRNDDLAARWDRFMEQPFDAERTFAINWKDGNVRDVPAGVVLAQVIHHGSDHRSQICTILTTLGVTIPPMGLWDYAEVTNRARPRDY